MVGRIGREERERLSKEKYGGKKEKMCSLHLI